MKRYFKFFYISFLTLSLIFFYKSYIFAAEPQEERGTTGYSEKIYSDEVKKSFLKNWNAKSRLNILFGHDNNVHLDTERRGSEFWETLWSIDFAKDLNEKLTGVFGYQFLNIVYTHADSVTFYKNTANMGLETKPLGRFSLFSNVYYDWLDYPNDNTLDYRGYRYDLGVKEQISKRLYHELKYEFLYKDYTKRLIRNADNVLEDTSKKRKDVRNEVGYEVGRFFNKSLLKLFYDYYKNESNERRLDYYDYDSHKIGSSFTYLFTRRFTGYLSLAHQWRLYKDRGTASDRTITSDDKTYLFDSSLFYKMNDALSLGLNYSYRENHSKEPSQKYSSSVVSTGVYYKF